MEIVKQEQSLETQVSSQFEEFKAQAAEWTGKALSIVVTDPSQTDIIAQAKEGRKLLASVRISIEKRRKELKEDSLRTGQTIDKVAKLLADEIAPAEAHLKAQEDFVAVQEKKAREELQAKRVAALQPYTDQDARTLPLAEMPEDGFKMMLKGYQDAQAAREEAKKKAEEERQAKEKADQEERERIKAENERLKKESEERGAEARRIESLWRGRLAELDDIRWNGQEAVYDGLVVITYDDLISIDATKFKAIRDRHNEEVENDKERKRIEAQNAAFEKQQAEAKLRDERAAREKLERDAQERAAKEEADRKAKAAADRKAKRAPDKVKLLSLAEQISLLEEPKLKDDDARAILDNAVGLLAKVVKYIKDNAEKL